MGQAREDKKLPALLMQAAILPAAEWAKEKEVVLPMPIAVLLTEGEEKKVVLLMPAVLALLPVPEKRKKLVLPMPVV